ncbi:hypothetical protein HHK36_029688 [Tetracentron sinense]|uniref:Enhanced disease susceptibility 1 n=1 Tax=Tetracentron sinense TaxID=13715 RepID=A0A834YBR1_TETSI|nr:hypothetical protein HHK36_029688 [Tetracentron sinense]
MERRKLGESVGIRDDLIQKACSIAMAAHNSPATTFLLDKPHNSSHAIFAFAGSWSVDDWFAHKSFGDSNINLSLFPSLRSIGNDQTAVINRAFLRQFETVLRTSPLSYEVTRAVTEKKQIVFTGHSSGGPVAILASIWLLEQHLQLDSDEQITPFCVTFGSPLVGDRVFGHALRRENWSHHFVHFVMRYDIIPRILLAPLTSIERELPEILQIFNPTSNYFGLESIGKTREASVFFSTVVRNISSVASHAACSFMGCTNLLLEAVTSFIELSPYRPFGTYVFCTGNGKLVIVKNPDAVLQILFYCVQLGHGLELDETAYRSLKEHLLYETELQESLEMQDVVNLDHPEEVPLYLESGATDEMKSVDMALNDLGLSTRARLCICAAREFEKQKLRNQAKINSYYSKIEDGLNRIHGYRATCEVHEVGYYDAFKIQREQRDFNTNLKRVDLAGMWDEIIEMLRRYELPDGFEVQKEWVELGTKYRCLVEPIEIANYYRHSMNQGLGPYLIKGRPKRYRYNQRWFEHIHRMTAESCSASCFWAEVEELCSETSNRTFEEMKRRVLGLEREVLRWVSSGELRRDVFFEESTFVKWWMTLPRLHRSGSCIARLMDGKGTNFPNLPTSS